MRIFLSVVLVLTICPSAHAWDKAAHRMITGHTLQILPEKMAPLLKQNEAVLFWGAVEPDFTRDDDHRLPVSFLRRASKPGGADSALDKLALQNPPPSHVIETTWRDAINDTVDVWQSIIYRALGPQKSLELYGIPAPKSQKGTGPSCR